MLDINRAVVDAEGYLNALKKLTDYKDTHKFGAIASVLDNARKNGTNIFILGNGGSAATANHFYCDFGKNASGPNDGRFKIMTLSEQVCAITALGNDCGFDQIFSMQLKNLMDEGDILIAISASGNSPNVINAVEYAKSKKGFIISLTGFNGGKLAKLSDIDLNVASDSYEMVEDVHLAMCHIIVWMFKMQRA